MKQENKTWYIAHNREDVFHFGEISEQAVIKTGQPFLEQFDSEEKMSYRLNSLTKDSQYYEKYLESINGKEDEEELPL